MCLYTFPYVYIHIYLYVYEICICIRKLYVSPRENDGEVKYMLISGKKKQCLKNIDFFAYYRFDVSS